MVNHSNDINFELLNWSCIECVLTVILAKMNFFNFTKRSYAWPCHVIQINHAGIRCRLHTVWKEICTSLAWLSFVLMCNLHHSMKQRALINLMCCFEGCISPCGLPWKKAAGCLWEILKENTLKGTKILFCGHGLKCCHPSQVRVLKQNICCHIFLAHTKAELYLFLWTFDDNSITKSYVWIFYLWHLQMG